MNTQHTHIMRRCQLPLGWKLTFRFLVGGRFPRERRMWTILTAGTRRFTCARACLASVYCARMRSKLNYRLLHYMYLFSYIIARRSDCVYVSFWRAHTLPPTIRFSRVNMFSSIRTHGIYYSRAQTIPNDFFLFIGGRWCARNFHCFRTLYLRMYHFNVLE